MVKLNVQIEKKTGIYENKLIADIDINNGNWKYWEIYTDGAEKQTLTINNVHDSVILNAVVKDAIGIHDTELWKNETELKVKDAMVRRYDNLLSYLNCRVNNVKDDFKKHGWTERTFTAVMFEEVYVKSADESVVRDIVYEADGLIEIKIKVIE